MQEKMPRKRDKEASKQALLRAGLDVFSKYGYEASTTKMVAAEAGLNEQLITRYFGGKSGLLLAALAAFIDEEADDYYPPAAEASRRKSGNSFCIGIDDFWSCKISFVLSSRSALLMLPSRNS